MLRKELMKLIEIIANGQKWLSMELHLLDFSAAIEQFKNIVMIFGIFNQFQFQLLLLMQTLEIEVSQI
jgi:hypothetical protein